tara:strand:- start:14705 stop:15385 length:681 start_codon:yes stop_codon:yes gene_type:complete
MIRQNNHSHEEGTDHPISKMLLARAARFEDELIAGYEAVKQHDKTVTFFGSARFTEDNPYYQKAAELAKLICKEGYTIITGGGGGIMEAGNRGSKDACNISVGFNIELPFEQSLNSHVTQGVNFSFFASRKVALYFSGEAYVFFPGGYGTLDEFFQILTLMQTHKRPVLPVICVGSHYWKNIDSMIKTTLLQENETISPKDVDLYTITDDNEEILELVKNSSNHTD